MDPFHAPAGLSVVTITGNDRATFLDSVLSQKLDDLRVGEVRSALWLDGHALPQLALDVAAIDDEQWWAIAPTDQLDRVTDGLAMRTFLADVTFQVTDHIVQALRPSSHVAVGTVTTDGEVTLIGRAVGVDVIGPADAVEAFVAEVPAREADHLEAFEVAHGIPRAPAELAPPHLPEETGLLPTHVHLAKGCYPGQEVVARMWNVGRPRRRLARLVVDGTVAPGAEFGEGRDRWTVTRTADWDGQSVALGYVPALAEQGQSVATDAGSLTIVGFVGDGLAQPGANPNATRGRDREEAPMRNPAATPPAGRRGLMG